MENKVHEFMQIVSSKNAGETEFLQAVEEVAVATPADRRRARRRAPRRRACWIKARSSNYGESLATADAWIARASNRSGPHCRMEQFCVCSAQDSIVGMACTLVSYGLLSWTSGMMIKYEL